MIIPRSWCRGRVRREMSLVRESHPTTELYVRLLYYNFVRKTHLLTNVDQYTIRSLILNWIKETVFGIIFDCHCDRTEIYKKTDCLECFELPATTSHHCQASVAICQDCGQQHPISRRMSKDAVTEGSVEGKSARVLRGTGCSTVVVRRSLVPDDKLTWLELITAVCMKNTRPTAGWLALPVVGCWVTAQGCVCRLCGDLKRPGGSVSVTKCALEVSTRDALYKSTYFYLFTFNDLIIGNIQGTLDTTDTQQSLARSGSSRPDQESNENRRKINASHRTCSWFRNGRSGQITKRRQKSKESHGRCQIQGQSTIPATKWILVPHKNRLDQEKKQLAVPDKLWQRVMTLAHAVVMSGYQGVHRTQDRATASFWWTRMTADVTRFVIRVTSVNEQLPNVVYQRFYLERWQW